MDWVERAKVPVGVNPGAALGLVMKEGRGDLVQKFGPLNVGADGDGAPDVFAHEERADEKFTDGLLGESGADGVGENVGHGFWVL